ncbi:hypothetical protein Acr_03g0018120 [Actinidia rufa]|uniref:Uncharacterized protein n=1 Tax=Actinidia rufa TaxID=165716 RepID=A0A7J0EEV6_9ERIC|nr:hypothetical protein Acr_03g0018120 [Actinidia rufa]
MAAAATSIAAILANLLLLLQPRTATANILSPILSPVLDDVCKEVECGKGTCKPSLNSTLLFVCECDIGWKQTRPDHDNDFKFLPCVIPNCTLDYSCSEAAPPVQDKESRANKSITNRALGMDCAGLGITLKNQSTSPTPGLVDNGTNKASSIPRGNMNWLVIVAMVLASLIWKSN